MESSSKFSVSTSSQEAHVTDDASDQVAFKDEDDIDRCRPIQDVPQMPPVRPVQTSTPPTGQTVLQITTFTKTDPKPGKRVQQEHLEQENAYDISGLFEGAYVIVLYKRLERLALVQDMPMPPNKWRSIGVHIIPLSEKQWFCADDVIVVKPMSTSPSPPVRIHDNKPGKSPAKAQLPPHHPVRMNLPAPPQMAWVGPVEHFPQSYPLQVYPPVMPMFYNPCPPHYSSGFQKPQPLMYMYY